MQATTLGAAQWRMLLLAGFGGALEFYDFVVFGVFAAAIGAAFFPVGDPLISQMTGYAGFALGYLARPLGGIVMAHWGDRGGRRRVFVGSVLAMSLATLAIGLLPTYAEIGPAAPALLLALRLAQGFCVGGELPGAVTYVVETAPARASFACGVVFACVNLGVLLAALVNLALRELAPEAAWGWRAAYLLGGALGLVGYPLRRSLAETPAFLALRAQVARLPLLEALRAWPVEMLLGIATTAATAAFNSVLFVLLPGYLTRTLHYPPGSVALAQAAGVAAYAAGLLAVARLGDRVERRWLLSLGAALLLAGCYPWFVAVVAQSAPLAALTVLAGLAGAWCSGVFAVLLADLFPARVRYSGIALPYNLSFTVFGGLFPLVATGGIAATGSPVTPAYALAVCAAVTLVGSVFLPGRDARR